MANESLAELAAVVGALGAGGVLLARTRLPLLAGFALLAAAEAGLLVARVPGEDLDRLARPAAIGALLLAALVVAAAAAALHRYPAVAPVALLAVAPFRVPVDLGSQSAFLLLPLYALLAAAVVALLVRAARGDVRPLHPFLGVPAAAFIGLSAVSLLWSLDPAQGSVQLLFFLFPAAALVSVVGRSPVAPWLPRALAATLVSLAAVFALIGLWQAATRRVFFAPDVEVANVYTSYFRVTSLFKDSSLYGRHLVLAIAVLLVALWLRRVHVGLAAAAVGLLFAGLWFAYSQSSLATLFAVAAVITLALADLRTRVAVAATCAVAAIAAAVVVVTAADGATLREATSGRSRLMEVTLPVIRNHPLAGAGIGAQPLASRLESDRSRRTSRYASHTTPLTVAAELGVLGLAAYALVLGGAVALLLRATRARRELALGLAVVLLALFLHSLVYAGFFEDPVTWGAIALAGAALTAPRAQAAVAAEREPLRRPSAAVPAR